MEPTSCQNVKIRESENTINAKVLSELLALCILLAIGCCHHGKLHLLTQMETCKTTLPIACTKEKSLAGIVTMNNWMQMKQAMQTEEITLLNDKSKDIEEIAMDLELDATETITFVVTPEVQTLTEVSVPEASVPEVTVPETSASEVEIENSVKEIINATEEFVKVEPSDKVLEHTGVESEVSVVGICCNTTLRQDYCVGSTKMIPELEICYSMSDGSIEAINLEDCVIGTIDTTEAGEKTLAVCCGDYEIQIPYQVVDYTVTLHLNGGNYEMDTLTAYDYVAEIPGNPRKVGCKSGSWYWDEACTMPVETSEIRFEVGETQIDLYAGYEEAGTFIIDSEGYVVGYEGEMLKELMLPENCVGVRANAFPADKASGVKYVYIPANVTDIQPGAFNAMSGVKDYLVISEENPVYRSINGMVVSKDESRLYVYPAGRRGEDYLPGTITYIEDYAFYDSSLSAIVFETEDAPVLGGSYCFAGCNATFYVSEGCQERYQEVFAVSGANIEEIE